MTSCLLALSCHGHLRTMHVGRHRHVRFIWAFPRHSSQDIRSSGSGHFRAVISGLKLMSKSFMPPARQCHTAHGWLHVRPCTAAQHGGVILRARDRHRMAKTPLPDLPRKGRLREAANHLPGRRIEPGPAQAGRAIVDLKLAPTRRIRVAQRLVALRGCKATSEKAAIQPPRRCRQVRGRERPDAGRVRPG